MLPDRVSNPGPLTYESGALPIALRGPASACATTHFVRNDKMWVNSHITGKEKEKCSRKFQCLVSRRQMKIM